MKVIARGRGTGKTKELLQQAYNEGGYVLTINKRGLQEKAQAYGFVGLNVLDWNDLMYGDYDATKPLYIHNIGEVMQELFDTDFQEMRINGFSTTVEE